MNRMVNLGSCQKGVWLLIFLVSVASVLHQAASFLVTPSHHRQQRLSVDYVDGGKLRMVRNIDLVEALIVYGSEVICGHDNFDWREGLETLVEECQADGASVLVLLNNNDSQIKKKLQEKKCHVLTQTVEPPNPRDLLTALESVTIQPHAFGGSAGFGQQQRVDHERSPIPSRTVVLTSSIEQTRAARCAGMRVVRLLVQESDDDHLADAVVEEIDFNVDDIATPGSFWLNPPHPRDDEGNRVDPAEVAIAMAQESDDLGVSPGFVQDESDNEELLRLLADIDPL
jgi:hypothetical protein